MNQQTCSICLQEYEYNDMSMTNCHHFFCESCLKEWLQKNLSCPVCRTNCNGYELQGKQYIYCHVRPQQTRTIHRDLNAIIINKNKYMLLMITSTFSGLLAMSNFYLVMRCTSYI
jgi:hypothetical protein